jgi:hypothetical protein
LPSRRLRKKAASLRPAVLKSGERQLLDLGQFAVGFVNPSGRGGAYPIGSGMLMVFDQIKGILTAAHVLDKLQEVDELGFVQFPNRPNQPQRIRVPFRLLDWARIGEDDDSDSGPDLAFIKLPEDTAASLSALGTFANFRRHRRLALAAGPVPDADASVDAVVGVVGEWRSDPFEEGASFIVTPI